MNRSHKVGSTKTKFHFIPRTYSLVLLAIISTFILASRRTGATRAASCVMNPVVTTNADSGAGSLRDAIANACSGSTITFADTVVSPIVLTNQGPQITNTLTIQGPGTRPMTISGGGRARIFEILEAHVNLSYLTLADGGNAIGLGDPGGAAAVYANGPDCLVNITNCTFTGNHNRAAMDGTGGAVSNSGTMNIINSTFSGNFAPGEAVGGGAIFNDINSTSGSGGGVYENGGTIKLQNTIVAGNTAPPGSGPDVFQGMTSLGNNLIGTNSGSSGFTNGVNGDLVGSDAVPINPLLGTLQNNGGPTFTMAELTGSPALNAGNGAVLGTPLFLTTDQRGIGFPRKLGPAVDIGAYEFGGPPTVAPEVDAPASVCPNSTGLTATGTAGESDYSWSITGGAITSGATGETVTFNAGSSGTVALTLTTTDGLGGQASTNASVTIDSVIVGPSTLPAGTIDSAYPSTQLTPNGAVFMTSGLPTGLTLSSSGMLSGTPTQHGSFNITVTAVGVCTGRQNYTLVINCPAITVSPATVPAGLQDEPYHVQFTQTGGFGATTFSATSTLPTGLTLSSSGLLSGTPTEGGTFSITVVATDSNGCTGSRAVSASLTALNKCLTDDHTGDFVQFSSVTGDYVYTHCGTSAFTLSGKGSITTPNGMLTITDVESGKNVNISYNPGALTGTAVITISTVRGVNQTYRISDANPHPVCACEA
jgi:hypothetical protein